MFSETSRGKVILQLSENERTILLDLFKQLHELIETPEIPKDADPLETLVGLSGPTNAPSDPAIARLFPNAYLDDELAASDFRRFTEPDLRSEKLSNVDQILSFLEKFVDKTELSREQVNIWLKSLNDLRLVLGTRIGITEESRENENNEPGLNLYDYLTYLQGTLIDVL